MKSKKTTPTPLNSLTDIGQAFLIARNKAGLQLQQVEGLSGVSSNTIAKLEKGKLENTSVKTLFDVANSLGLEIELKIKA